uniref:DUF2439 domain-containing protein n=1 Tax=Heterorhabditis bacteriophora TaxID=37862 RepID=A0A1I7XCB7_HETBA
MLAYELNNKISSIGEHPDELARFIVLYAQASTRKHKRWRGDGILICYENIALLKSEDEKLIICRAMFKKHPNDLEDGEIIKISNLEVQIQERIQEVKSRASGESSFSMVESTNEEHDLLAKSSLLNKPINDLAGKTPPLIINEQDVKEGNDSPVIVDAFIARNLRDHQKDGVRFIYSKLKNERKFIMKEDYYRIRPVVLFLRMKWALAKLYKQ